MQTRLIELMQQSAFGKELDVLRKGKVKKRMGTLWRLSPFLDRDGVLRVGDRLSNSLEEETIKFPAIIPSD